VNKLVVVRLPVDWLLATALVPPHAPDAEHVVALVLLQVNVLLPPEATLVGLALNVKVGTVPPPPTAVTTIVVELVAPLQFRL